jgi:hypothetical protein
MRPIYETDYDRQREGSVSAYVTEKYRCTFKKSEDLTSFDGVFADYNGQDFAVAEIKVRNNRSDKYPTYMISAAKVDAILAYANDRALFPMLLVGFTNGVFITKLSNHYLKSLGGRRDRNDPSDIEVCVYIPMERFKAL